VGQVVAVRLDQVDPLETPDNRDFQDPQVQLDKQVHKVRQVRVGRLDLLDRLELPVVLVQLDNQVKADHRDLWDHRVPPEILEPVE